MKTETENLRELDDWIAINVMDLKFNGHNWVLASDENLCAKLGGHCPEYTIDPAAAMQVLEKCVRKLQEEDKEETVSVGCDDPYFVVEKTNCIPNLRVEAPTLPLAIVRFAKQLFSK